MSDPRFNPDPLDAPHGSRSACFADGSGFLVSGASVVGASGAAAPAVSEDTAFEGQSLLGAFSVDGSNAYAIGALGAFMKRSATVTTWSDTLPTVRRDLLRVDVGAGGDVMAVSAFGLNRSSGGEVLVWRDGALKVAGGSGLMGPRLPLGAAVVGKDDAWGLSGENGGLSVAHWTGSWGASRFLAHLVDGLAIWAADKDDIWVTGQERCRDLVVATDRRCTHPQRPSAWHYDGASWTKVSVDGSYRSIHGSSTSDVWFAGDTVAHGDGTKLSSVPTLKGPFTGVWSSAPGWVWLWGDSPVFYDGHSTIPVRTALGASAEWAIQGIAESASGDIFVLTRQAVGTVLLWFDGRTKQLVKQLSSDLALTTIRGRGNRLWAVGAGGAALRFTVPPLR